MLVYPFIFEVFSTNTSVNMTAVNEFRNMSRRINGIQLIAILDSNEYLEILNYSKDPIEAISTYVNMSMNLTIVTEKRGVKTNTTTTIPKTTPSPTETTLTTTTVDPTTPTPYSPTSETSPTTYTSPHQSSPRPTTIPEPITRPKSKHTTSPTHTPTLQTSHATPYVTTPLNTIAIQTTSERTDITTELSSPQRPTLQTITKPSISPSHTVGTDKVLTTVDKQYSNIVIAIILAIPMIIMIIAYQKAKQ